MMISKKKPDLSRAPNEEEEWGLNEAVQNTSITSNPPLANGLGV
jgi:hypothetical protein